MHGRQQLGAFSLGAEVAGEGVALACSYPHGLAVLTAATSSVWAVEGLAQPRPHRLAGLPLQFQGLAPTALAVVDPAHPVSGCLEVCGLRSLPAWVAAAQRRCAAGWRCRAQRPGGSLDSCTPVSAKLQGDLLGSPLPQLPLSSAGHASGVLAAL